MTIYKRTAKAMAMVKATVDPAATDIELAAPVASPLCAGEEPSVDVALAEMRLGLALVTAGRAGTLVLELPAAGLLGLELTWPSLALAIWTTHFFTSALCSRK
jgi:hypothetical protein